MARTTIDFGIDLGTTNSSIAVLKGTETVVFRNNEGAEYTPSAVWIDKNGTLRTGRRAKEQLDSDPGNAFSEFKLQMGASREFRFARAGRSMQPEEMSAEVLKELKKDVKQRTGEDVQSAVITVPAAFELPQCEATKKAAELAGFVSTRLLQEPVAAALAYGFQAENDKRFWLAYDFGGGTFDAALIHLRDGAIQVVNHGGDNHLGGKLIDWGIVEDLLIPALTKERPLADFKRSNKRFASAFAKLKREAEEAKILVSRDDSAEIEIDFTASDLGEGFSFRYELRRKDVERIADPFILRSINICRRVLAEARLGTGDIEKLLLVGGPTLTPRLRERLSDKTDGLGIGLEFSQDPLTVVARGAAIFAGTQRPEGVIAAESVGAGQFAVQLDYKPMGADTEPLVGGRVVAPEGGTVTGFTIEFVNAEARPQWRSGKIGLAPDGAFLASLWAEKGHPNTFQIELCDVRGTLQATVPDRLTYLVSVVLEDPPLIHSVGVALANNEMEWLINKGTLLPARKLTVLRTAREIRKGQAGHVLKIPIMEGQNNRADRNQVIGHLEITSAQVRRDVPAGSEIEVTIAVDASRILRAKAFLPILDEEFEKVVSYEEYRKKGKNPDELQKDIERQRKRLDQAREQSRQTGDTRAGEAVQRIDQERMLHDAESAFAASKGDEDAGDKCEKRLLDLKSAIDEVEDALEWPALVAEANKEIEVERKIVNNADFGVTPAEKAAFAGLEREIRSAIEARDKELLRGKVQEMDRIGVLIVTRQDAFWVARFQNLEGRRALMQNQTKADEYISQARRAMNNNDVEGLKAAVRQLQSLLPSDNSDQSTDKSGVIR